MIRELLTSLESDSVYRLKFIWECKNMLRLAFLGFLALALNSCMITSKFHAERQADWLQILDRHGSLLNHKEELRSYIATSDTSYDTLQRLSTRQLKDIEKAAKNHGIPLKKYPLFLSLKKAQVTRSKEIESLLVADLILSVAAHLRFGIIEPKNVNPNWRSLKKRRISGKILADLKPDQYFQTKLELFAPQNPGYQRLARWIRSKDLEPRKADSLNDLRWRVMANMERWRGLQNQLGHSYVIANVANASLALVSDNKTVLSSRIVVGRLARQTPVFSSKIDHIVWRPNWTIPRTIWSADVLPMIRRKPSYADERDIGFFKKSRRRLSSIDNKHFFSMNKDEQLKAVAIQKHGPLNPLGDVKIGFDNQHQIFLHDSPNPNQYNSKQWTLSSGCIRVEKAEELAMLLEDLGQASTRDLHDGDRHVFRSLKSPIPIHIVYLSVWIDESGKLYQVDDPYERDSVMASLLIHSKRL